MFNFSISFKLSGAIVSILAGSLLIISFLNYFNFTKDLQIFVTSRFEVLSKDLKGTIEYGLNLGLGLGDLKTIQEILEEKNNEQDINNLLVTNNQGKMLFHSDPAKLKDDMTFHWYQLFKSNNITSMMSSVTIEDKDNYLLVTPLINNFNVKVGSLILSYPQAVIKQPQKEMISFLIYRFAVVFVGGSIVVFLVIRLFFKHFFANILRILEESLQPLLAGHSQDDDPEIEVTPDLKNSFLPFHRKARKLLVLLNAEADKMNIRGSEND